MLTKKINKLYLQHNDKTSSQNLLRLQQAPKELVLGIHKIINQNRLLQADFCYINIIKTMKHQTKNNSYYRYQTLSRG